MKKRKEKIMKFASFTIIPIILLSIMPISPNSPNIQDAVNYAKKNLLLQDGISGLMINDSRTPPTLTILVENEQSKSLVPSEIKGFKVETKIVGRFDALASNERRNDILPLSAPLFNRKGTVRPLVGGVSLGNWCPPWSITAGTLGVCFKPPGYTSNYILTNAHVIAEDSLHRLVPLGTSVIQPGKADGGNIFKIVGKLSARIIIQLFVYGNHADCAMAKVSSNIGVQLNKELAGDNINTYTVSVTNMVVPSEASAVRKSGRTTGVTTGWVYDNSATVKVYYGLVFWAGFDDIILVHQPFCEGGDSGSFVDQNGKFVGLVFAGSDEYAIVCKAGYIADLWS